MTVATKQFWRAGLPHWDVVGGTYFFTIRVAGSLPRKVVARLVELRRQMKEAPDPTVLLEQQRRYFRVMEKHLDAGEGFCPFRHDAVCRILVDQLEGLSVQGWRVRHYCIMPNHFHAILATEPNAGDMKSTWQAFKGRSARFANRELGRSGAFWQREWFDRWMRDAESCERTLHYIRQNPVKAGLVDKWEDHPWTR